MGPWLLRRLELLAMGEKQARQYSWVQSTLYVRLPLVNDHLCYATVLCFMWQLMCFLFYIVGVWCVVYRNKLEREQEYHRSLYWAGKVSVAFLRTIFCEITIISLTDPLTLACPRLSDSGNDAKVKGRRKYKLMIRGPDYVVAWNRLLLPKREIG